VGSERGAQPRTVSLGMRAGFGPTSRVPGRPPNRLTVSAPQASRLAVPSGTERARRPVPYEIVPAALRRSAPQVEACCCCPPVSLRDLDSPRVLARMWHGPRSDHLAAKPNQVT